MTIMPRCALIATALIITAAPVRAQEKAKEDPARLIEVLKSAQSSEFDKAKACQRLALVGAKEAVPVLAAMLSDEKLAHYARFALEPILDPSVDDALRAAMGKLKGKLLAGVLSSIGRRQDAKAVDGLTGLLGDAPIEAAAAAAAALGHIGSPEAAKSLRQALGGPAALRPAAGDACLICAQVLLRREQPAEAVALYDAMRKAELPKHLQMAAARGAILARQADGVPLLLELLRADDKNACGVALRAVRELAGGEVTTALVAELDKLPPERQALLIDALGDRRDAAVVPAALKAATSETPGVRAAAIRVLAQLGDASVVPVLLDAAVQADAEVARVARAGLASLRGKEVDAALAALLDKSEGKVRCVVIDSLGRRRVVAALPALMMAADHADQQVRLAALKAMGETAGPEELPTLTARILKPQTPEEAAAAAAAVTAVCTRSDRDACADKLVAAMSQAPVATKCRLLEILGVTGGAKALKAVVAGAGDADPDLQDAAFRILGEWMNADAAPELLNLAKTAANNKYRIRALRGYIRIARQLDLKADERLAMCRQALAAAQRDDEKKLVLEVLGRHPSAESLALVAGQASSPGLKEDACTVAVTLAEKIGDGNPGAVADAMKQVMRNTGNKDLAGRAKALLDRVEKKAKDR